MNEVRPWGLGTLFGHPLVRIEVSFSLTNARRGSKGKEDTKWKKPKKLLLFDFYMHFHTSI